MRKTNSCEREERMDGKWERSEKKGNKTEVKIFVLECTLNGFEIGLKLLWCIP